MRTKLIGFGIGIMLLTTFLAVAHPIQKTTINDQTEPPTVSMVDVPVWNLGDTWTYKINDIAVDITDERLSLKLYFSIQELPLVVTDTTDEDYTLSFTTTMTGNGHINTDTGEGPVNVSVLVEDMELSGFLVFEKSTLGIKDIGFSFDKEKFTFHVIEQPYIPLPAWLKVISAKFTSNLDIDSDTSVALLSFPLETGISWNLSAANLTVNGKVESLLFNLINFINNLLKIINRDFLPPEVAALLPVIDVKDALTQFIGSNVFQVPILSDAFFCLNTEYITVPAGIFEAFNITLLGGIGHCYFAPEAGTIILMTGNFQDVIPFITNIDMELLSTTYS